MLEQIKEKLNEDVIGLVLSFLPKKKDIIYEAKQKTLMLYREIINKTRFSKPFGEKRVFEVGDIYYEWIRDFYGESVVNKLIVMKIVKRTKCYVWVEKIWKFCGSKKEAYISTLKKKINIVNGNECIDLHKYLNLTEDIYDCYVKKMIHLDYFTSKFYKEDLKLVMYDRRL